MVKFWDPRFTESVRRLETVNQMSAFEVHSSAKVIARLVFHDHESRQSYYSVCEIFCM